MRIFITTCRVNADVFQNTKGKLLSFGRNRCRVNLRVSVPKHLLLSWDLRGASPLVQVPGSIHTQDEWGSHGLQERRVPGWRGQGTPGAQTLSPAGLLDIRIPVVLHTMGARRQVSGTWRVGEFHAAADKNLSERKRVNLTADLSALNTASRSPARYNHVPPSLFGSHPAWDRGRPHAIENSRWTKGI